MASRGTDTQGLDSAGDPGVSGGVGGSVRGSNPLIGLPKRSSHPDQATEAWLSFVDRQSMMLAKVAGAEVDPPEVSPLEEAGATIVVALTNRMAGKIADLFEAVLDKLTAWVKLPRKGGFKWPRLPWVKPEPEEEGPTVEEVPKGE